MRFFSRISFFFGGEKRALRGQLAREKRRNKAIVAASAAKVGAGWGLSAEEDSLNKEYLTSLSEVLQRSQDLDVNNPDLHGFHRTRTAHIVGKGVQFKAKPLASEVGLDPKALVEITGQLDRLRELHSNLGGFDSTGNNRSEGTQQERAMLTALVTGSCLVHRVWKMGGRALLPFSLELIPGTRISTPYDKLGNPRISYGIEYTDEHRTQVVGYHVRRVSTTRGNSFIPDYVWDFVPVIDCSLLSLTEMAGLDRAMPISLSVVRMMRNRGEFIESAVEAARAQSHFYTTIEVAPGDNAFDRAEDDADGAVTDSQGKSMGFMKMGGVSALYLQNGEKANWNAAKMPDPDFTGFMDVTDGRCARGLVSSLSRFTRKVTSSWAGGRMEDQQDDPIIDQYRGAFISAWRLVHEWFMEAVWLTDKVKLAGYSEASKAYWSECRAEFPGKVHINPTDTASAREKGYMLRTLTPQQACEEDGKDLRGNLRQWAEAVKLVSDIEKEYDLPEGTLSFLLSGKAISTSAGDEIASPTPAPEPQPGEDDDKPAARRTSMNRLRKFLMGGA